MTINERRCEWSGCSDSAGPAEFVYGRAYCPQHYFSGIESALIEEIRELKEGQQPSTKFRNLFKRYLEGLLRSKTPPGLAMLTPSQIESRSILSHISEENIEFSIERHGSFVPETYYFQLSIKDREIDQVSCEPDYLTVAEFAKRSGLTEQKVRMLIKRGGVEAIRARELQDEWYYSMVAGGRRSVRIPWKLGHWDSFPRRGYLIPFGEIERYSKLDKLYEKDEKDR